MYQVQSVTQYSTTIAHGRMSIGVNSRINTAFVRANLKVLNCKNLRQNVVMKLIIPPIKIILQSKVCINNLIEKVVRIQPLRKDSILEFGIDCTCALHQSIALC